MNNSTMMIVCGNIINNPCTQGTKTSGETWYISICSWANKSWYGKKVQNTKRIMTRSFRWRYWENEKSFKWEINTLEKLCQKVLTQFKRLVSLMWIVVLHSLEINRTLHKIAKSECFQTLLFGNLCRVFGRCCDVLIIWN